MIRFRSALIAACALSLGAGAVLLSADAAQAAKKERTAISKECSAKADAQKLHGKERRAFRAKCKREAGAVKS